MSLKIKNFAKAFTIVELLIAIAISAILLAAVAVAFNASIINYNENQDMFKATNSSRQALFRITTQLRTADSVDPCSPVNECSTITSDSEDITYRYNNSDNKLYLVTNDDPSDSDYVLCENVTDMTFTNDTASDEGGIYVRSVVISMTVQSGNTQKTMAAAAVIRRNLN